MWSLNLSTFSCASYKARPQLFLDEWQVTSWLCSLSLLKGVCCWSESLHYWRSKGARFHASYMASRLAFGACVGAFLPQVAAKTETCSGLTCDADGESWLSCRLWLLLLVLGVTMASVSGNARIPSPAGGRFPTPIEVSFCGTHGQNTKVVYDRVVHRKSPQQIWLWGVRPCHHMLRHTENM